MRPAEAAALQRADAVYAVLDDFKAHATQGRHDEAGRALSTALRLAGEGISELAGIIAAQGETAEVGHLPQRRLRVICAIGVTKPHPHPANAHAANSEQPAPTIA